MTAMPVFLLSLRTEKDVVQARQLAREIAAEVGLDNQEQIRMATATSEMARNAFRYARGGKVTFSLRLDTPQAFVISVNDAGPGIANMEEILEGRYRSMTGLGMGIAGTKRLMDNFEIDTSPNGTNVRMLRHIPRTRAPLTSRFAHQLSDRLQQRAMDTPYGEIERQNQELLRTLQELHARQDDLEWLNRELEDTNRGVVALYAELDERADYLRRASELKTKFLSNVSHEFRSPLNSIISLSHLLLERLDGNLTSNQEKQVHYIEACARDLQELVNDLLDLAKVEAGKVKIRAKRFEVGGLFSALKGMLKPLLANNTSVDLVFGDSTGLPLLHTDEGKVSQILRNLISNALKFTPGGKITVEASVTADHQILFTVADTGIGIPAEHLETIFQEFSQVDNPLQELHRGTGLGLPLCRNFATLLGGRIWVESEVGKGSAFYVQLPAAYVGESAPAVDAPPPDAPEFHHSPVLILESDVERVRQLEISLRESEFQAIFASSAEQAQAWLNRHRPVAVVARVPLDGTPEAGLLAEFADRYPETPVLLARDTPEDAGESAAFRWPFDGHALRKQLQRVTSNSNSVRLLLTDDNEVARYIVQHVLVQPWLHIEEASNAAQTWQALEARRPDALILDVLMPDANGLEILKKMRQNPATKDLPVLIFTSKRLTETERLEVETHHAEFLLKEDVSRHLSARPFLEWLKKHGLPSGDAQARS